MSERVIFFYDKEELAALYTVLMDRVENSKEEYVRDSCKKVIDKIETYYSIDEDTDENETLIRVGYFDNEIRLIGQLLLWNLMDFMKTDKRFITKFDELVNKRKEAQEDPSYYTKIQIKHFSEDAAFLSNESEKLLSKGKKILSCINEKTNEVILGPTDFASRCWVLMRCQKTKTTQYDIQETKEGYEITKIVSYKKEGQNPEGYKITLNNETLEFKTETFEPEQDEMCFDDDEEKDSPPPVIEKIKESDMI